MYDQKEYTAARELFATIPDYRDTGDIVARMDEDIACNDYIDRFSEYGDSVERVERLSRGLIDYASSIRDNCVNKVSSDSTDLYTKDSYGEFYEDPNTALTVYYWSDDFKQAKDDIISERTTADGQYEALRNLPASLSECAAKAYVMQSACSALADLATDMTGDFSIVEEKAKEAEGQFDTAIDEFRQSIPGKIAIDTGAAGADGTEAETAPAGAETEAETASAAAETAPAAVGTEAETVPAFTETEAETTPAAGTEAETVPVFAETEAETTPAAGIEAETEATHAEAQLTFAGTEPAAAETEAETYPTGVQTEAETIPATAETEAETMPASAGTEAETESETDTAIPKPLPGFAGTEAETKTETETDILAINISELVNGSITAPNKPQAPSWEFKIGGIPLLNVTPF